MANTKPPEGRRFTPGNNANPLGAGAHNPLVKAIRKMTQQDLAEMWVLMCNGDIDSLREIKDYPSGHSVWRAMLASAMVTAFDKGDMTAMNALLDRIIGKVKDKLEVTLPKPMTIEFKDGRQIILGNQLTKVGIEDLGSEDE